MNAMSSASLGPYPRAQTSVRPLPRAWSTWPMICCFIAVTVAGLATGLSTGLRIVYPVMAFAIALVLFLTDRMRYIAFTWWLWFLTPFVRRLIDNQSGWVDPSPVLLAPLLASLIASLSLLEHFRFFAREGLPYLMCFGAIGYAVCVSLAHQVPMQTVVLPLLGWLAPLAFGFSVYTGWREYPQYRNCLRITFLCGGLVMGAYGVFQFLIAPEWDRFWMMNVGYGSFGAPEPLQIRVFSTMNAPQSFAVTLMACLFIVVAEAKIIQVPVTVASYLAFLLTSSRGAWLGWVVGMVVLILCIRPTKFLRTMALMGVLGGCLAPWLLQYHAFDVVRQRFDSFSDGKSDISYQARGEGYAALLAEGMMEPFGKGLGVMDREHATLGDDDRLGPHDSMYLELLLSLGWFGAAAYLFGILLCVGTLMAGKAFRQDVFLAACLAHIVALIVQFPLESFALSVQGMSLWTFLSLAIAAHKYHSAEAAGRRASDTFPLKG